MMEGYISKILGNRETFDRALEPFRDGYEGLGLEAKQEAVRGLFDCFQETFGLACEVKLYGKKDVELRFFDKLGTEQNSDLAYFDHSDGTINFENEFFSEFSGSTVIGMFCHEYYHAIDYCIEGQHMRYSDIRGNIGHDTEVFEVDATKFGMRFMNEFGFDEKEFIQYNQWQKAFKIAENADKITNGGPYGDMYGKKLANDYLKFYGNLETRQWFRGEDLGYMKWKENKKEFRKVFKDTYYKEYGGDNKCIPVGAKVLVARQLHKELKQKKFEERGRITTKGYHLNKYFEFEKAMKSNPGFDSEEILRGVREQMAEQGIKIRRFHVKGKNVIRSVEKAKEGARGWQLKREEQNGILERDLSRWKDKIESRIAKKAKKAFHGSEEVRSVLQGSFGDAKELGRIKPIDVKEIKGPSMPPLVMPKR